MYFYGHAPNWSMVLLGRLFESSCQKSTLGRNSDTTRYGYFIAGILPEIAWWLIFYFFAIQSTHDGLIKFLVPKWWTDFSLCDIIHNNMHLSPIFPIGTHVIASGLATYIENCPNSNLQSKWKLCAVGFMQLSLERVVISTWGLRESV